MASLAEHLRTLCQSVEVGRLPPLRRATMVFSQGQPAEAVYFLQEGLVKLTRTSDTGSRILLTACGPGEILGDEALLSEVGTYQVDAEVVANASLVRIPREVILRAVKEDGGLAAAVIGFLIDRRAAMSRKVELLCLHDVEYRILHYLRELSELVPAALNGEGRELPITQAELADLVGATRETTSTTLNQLERRGLVKLSRRLLTVPLQAKPVASTPAAPATALPGSALSEPAVVVARSA